MNWRAERFQKYLAFKKEYSKERKAIADSIRNARRNGWKVVMSPEGKYYFIEE